MEREREVMMNIYQYHYIFTLFELQFVANAQTPYATLLGNSFEGEQL